MAITSRAFVIGVTKYFADGEQIDAGVDHERRGGVAQVMDPQIAQAGILPCPLPTVFDADEGQAGVQVGDEPGTVLKTR